MLVATKVYIFWRDVVTCLSAKKIFNETSGTFFSQVNKIFWETSGHFPVMFVPTISDIFDVTSGQLLAYYILYYGHNKIRHFKLKHDLFQSLTKYFLCLNLTRPQAQNCHNTNWKRKVLKFILVTGLSVFYRFTSCLINKSNQYLFPCKYAYISSSLWERNTFLITILYGKQSAEKKTSLHESFQRLKHLHKTETSTLEPSIMFKMILNLMSLTHQQWKKSSNKFPLKMQLMAEMILVLRQAEHPGKKL